LKREDKVNGKIETGVKQPRKPVKKPDSWAELPVRMKVLWILSFLFALLVGIAMGIYLTYA